MSIQQSLFGFAADGKEVTKFTIKNKGGSFIELLTYGATWLSCFVPDRDGVYQDVLLGFDDMDGHLNRSNYQGQFVGRFANRIANGRFTINGEEFQVVQNEAGTKSLHSNGEFSHAVFDAEIIGDDAVAFTFTSPDGTFGFPGTVTATVTYTFTDENEVVIDYRAVSDKATLINLTNHAYFNLGGCNSGDVLGHELMIDADAFTPTEPNSIPTGEIRPVESTPFDFRKPKPIGRDIGADYDQLINCKGYDHNFCLNPGSGVKARAFEPKSGRTLSMTTDRPGVQLYTGNFLDGKKGKSGCPMTKHAGFCLETQVYPDAPNHDNFPQCTYQAGEEFVSRTVYKFGVNLKK